MMDHKDIVLGPKPGKFAILCNRKILVAAPRSRSLRSTQGTLAVQLKYADRKHMDNFNYSPIGKFSMDGCKLGLVHPYSEALHIWDLEGGVRLGPLLAPEALRFCDYAFSQDGNHIVACMCNGALFLWSVSRALGFGEIVQVHVLPVNTKDEQSGDPCKAIGFSIDENGDTTVVVCDGLGSLWWFGAVECATQTAVRSRTLSERGVRDTWQEIIRKASRTDVLMSITWGLLESVEANAQFSCKFSADGSVGVLMPNPKKAEVWDLVGRKILQTCNFQVNLGSSSTFSFPHNIAFSGDFALVGARAAVSKFVHCTTSSTYDDLKQHVSHQLFLLLLQQSLQ